MGGLLAQLSAVGAFDDNAAGAGDSDQPGDNATAYLWPDCMPAWNHWRSLQTQWRSSGMGGREGLDYAGVQAYLDEHLPRRGRRRRELFACIQACETACLDFWAEARERDQQNQPPPHNP